MNKLVQILCSAFTAFAITAGGSLLVLLASNGKAALNATAWIISGVVGIVAAAKDVRNLLQLPPVSGNGSPLVSTETLTVQKTTSDGTGQPLIKA